MRIDSFYVVVRSTYMKLFLIEFRWISDFITKRFNHDNRENKNGGDEMEWKKEMVWTMSNDKLSMVWSIDRSFEGIENQH